MVKEQLDKVEQQIETLQESLNRLYKIRKKLEDKLKSECKHEKTFKHEVYHPGSYLDRASTKHQVQCRICKKVISEKIETHNWYG